MEKSRATNEMKNPTYGNKYIKIYLHFVLVKKLDVSRRKQAVAGNGWEGYVKDYISVCFR